MLQWHRRLVAAAFELHRRVGRELAQQPERGPVLGHDRRRERLDSVVDRPALGLLRKLSPDASVHFEGGGYEASMPLPRAS